MPPSLYDLDKVHNKLETPNKTMQPSMYDLDKSTTNGRRSTKQCHHPCTIQTSPQQTGDAQQNKATNHVRFRLVHNKRETLNNATIHVRSRQVHNKLETPNKTMPPSMYDLDKSTTNWRRSTEQCHHPCTIQTSPQQTGYPQQNNATIHVRFRQVHYKLETLNKTMPTIHARFRSRQVHNKLETLNKIMPPSMYDLDKSTTNWRRPTKQCHHPCTIQTIPQQTGDAQQTKQCHHPCTIQTSPQQTGDAQQNNATIHVPFRQVRNKLDTLNKTLPPSMYDLDKSTTNWRR